MFNLTLVISLLYQVIASDIWRTCRIKRKYYRDNHVSFSIPVTENHGGSGLNQVRVEGLPSGWTQTLLRILITKLVL